MMAPYFLATALVMLASGSALMLSAWCDKWLASVGWLALVGMVWWGSSRGWRGCGWRGCRGRRGWRGCHGRPGWLPAVASLVGLAALAPVALDLADPVMRTLAVAWLFGVLHLLQIVWQDPGSSPRRPAEPPGFLPLHLATAGFALGLAAYGRSSTLWFAARRLAGLVSLGGAPTGIWVSGWPIYAFGGLVLCWTVALRRTVSRGTAAAWAALFLAAVASSAVVGRLTPVNQIKVSCAHLGALALAGGVAWRTASGTGGHAVPGSLGSRSGLTACGARVWHRYWPLVSLCLSAAALAVLGWPCPEDNPSCSLGSTRSSGRRDIGLYSAGFVDWRVPDYERLGLANSGMFGLLRVSLERWAAATGGRLILLDPAGSPDSASSSRSQDSAALADSWDAISPEALGRMSAIIFINPTRRLEPRVLESVEAFVRSGGGLLVLGDHTDIAGSREPLNSLLSFTGISFNFDSAVPLRRHWRGCLEVRGHAVTASFAGRNMDCADRMPEEIMAEIAVGASLEIRPPAIPLVVGRYGFSDEGDRANGGNGAYLGDLMQGGRERAGDVVLVACQQIGRGRVLVFGDTSPFQNGALVFSGGLAEDAVAWVGGRGRSPSGSPARLAWSDRTALIDFSLHPRASAALFAESSLGGLANCLAREGIVAAPAPGQDRWCDLRRDRPDYIFLVSPTQMNDAAAAHLVDYAAGGGQVILCAGYEQPQACAPLLTRVGLEICDIPLGRGERRARAGELAGQGGGPEDQTGELAEPVAERPGRVVHKDAWAIRCDPLCAGSAAHGGWDPAGAETSAGGGRACADTSVLASAFGYPTVVRVGWGRGAITLVADSGLLLDGNLEGERRANRTNVAFVRRLLGGVRVTHGPAGQN